jgi:hypothetical protein
VEAEEAEAVQRDCKEVAANTSGVIISDVPWLTAWYSGRTSVWLPREWDDLDRMETAVGQIQYILLTPQVANVVTEERTEAWARLWSAAQMVPRGEYKGFTVVKRIGASPPYWVLLRKEPSLPGHPAEEEEGTSG